MQKVAALRARNLLIIVVVTLSLLFANVLKTEAQTGNAEIFFSAEYGGISIKVDATKETFPGANMTFEIAVNATADGVQIEYLNISVYGFINGHEQTLLNSTNVMEASPLQFNETNKTENTITVPSNVWGITYGQIFLRYNIKDLPSTERNPGFPLTTVRNVHLENLESELKSLNQSHNLLRESFRNLTAEFEKLNETYTDLQGNYSELQGNVGGLEGTRTVAVILTITTVFFVATTLYLVTRRPKEYW
jgi:hypothetical protein